MRRNFVPACMNLETRLALSGTVVTTIGTIGQVVHTQVGGSSSLHLPSAAAKPTVVTTIGSIGQVVHTEVGGGSSLHLPKVTLH